MKHIVPFLIIFQLFMSVQGQDISAPNRYKLDDYTFHFGFCLGINMMNFMIQPNYQYYKKDSLLGSISNPNFGFQIQIVTNLRLGEYFDLRFLPGIAFGERDLNFFRNGVLVGSSEQIESNFLEFPLLVKYKAKRLKNFRPYVLTGGNCRVDLAKSYNEAQGVYIQLKKFDYYYEAGTGIDFYLEYFKLSTEIKYSLGLRNLIDQRTSNMPQFENSIGKLRSSMVMLSFCFE